jgi:hypothetical protein
MFDFSQIEAGVETAKTFARDVDSRLEQIAGLLTSMVLLLENIDDRGVRLEHPQDTQAKPQIHYDADAKR